MVIQSMREVKRLNLGGRNGDISTSKIKWEGLGKPWACEGEGGGAVEN